jgi:hypothetical protein
MSTDRSGIVVARERLSQQSRSERNQPVTASLT